ncbi:cupin domain-containing protein [Edaphovirga cremea]|uniref:cupin domain-containing protein n=1 Tax=Edaphovirga cremea TaxID=2267246 RepID=UPI003989D9ED
MMEIVHIHKPCKGVPNSPLPLLIYRKVIEADTKDVAESLEHLFAKNDWPPHWRSSVYPFTHFHTTTHEVVGVYVGSAELQLGGDNGKVYRVEVGDVILIPSGVGHKCISATDDFMLVGAYPTDHNPDICRDQPEKLSERTEAIKRIELPQSDPVLGRSEGCIKQWQSEGA